MKYGQLSHGNVDIGSTKASLIASGGDDDRPSGEDGQIRYNKDTRVEGLGEFDGYGRFELYKNGEWVPLLTEADMQHSDEVAGKDDLNDNIMFKYIAEVLRDTFATAIGTLELIQTGKWPIYFGNGAGEPSIEPGNVRTNVSDLPGYLSDLQVSPEVGGAMSTFGASGETQKSFTKTTGGGSLDASFKAILGNGKVYKVHVNNRGSGYNPENPPSVSINTGGGSGAILKAEIVSGVITQVNVINGGSGYRDGKTKIYLKGGGYRNLGELKPVIQGGVIVAVSIIAQGDGYRTAPQLFVGDGGFGASFKANVNQDGTIHSIAILNPGFDYLVAPAVVISPPENSSNTTATATATVGSGKVIDIMLQKQVTTTTMVNGVIPLTVTGNGSGCSAELVIKNGVGTHVRLKNRGAGYTYASATAPAGSLTTITGTDFQQYHYPNVFLEFKFDVFEATGIPPDQKKLYDVALMSNLYKIHPFGAVYAGQTIAMGVKFTPQWTPFNNNTHPNYGVYKTSMSLYGQRGYYTSAVGASWMSNLVKTRFE